MITYVYYLIHIECDVPPSTLRKALTKYLDVTSTPSRDMIHDWMQYTSEGSIHKLHNVDFVHETKIMFSCLGYEIIFGKSFQYILNAPSQNKAVSFT